MIKREVVEILIWKIVHDYQPIIAYQCYPGSKYERSVKSVSRMMPYTASDVSQPSYYMYVQLGVLRVLCRYFNESFVSNVTSEDSVTQSSFANMIIE